MGSWADGGGWGGAWGLRGLEGERVIVSIC